MSYGSRKKDIYNLGGFLKKALPIAATAANFIPGVGPAAAMGINMGARALSSAIPGEEQPQVPQGNNTVTRGSSSYGLMKGGGIIPIGQNAAKFKGKKHSQGGIKLSELGIEVEGDETLDFIDFKNGGAIDGRSGEPYVFSDSITVPETDQTFSEVHEQLVMHNASEEQVKKLAQLQEKVSGRSSEVVEDAGSITGNKSLQHGGLINDEIEGEENEYTEKVRKINQKYSDLDLLPSEVSGRDKGAFMGAMFSTSPSEWTGLRAHWNEIRKLDEEERGKYKKALENERKGSTKKLEKIRSQLEKQNRSMQHGGLLTDDEDEEIVPSDTTNVDSSTITEHQENVLRRNLSLKERLERMRQGDYSMVGQPLEADTLSVEELEEFEDEELKYGGKMKYQTGGIPPWGTSGFFRLDIPPVPGSNVNPGGFRPTNFTEEEIAANPSPAGKYPWQQTDQPSVSGTNGNANQDSPPSFNTNISEAGLPATGITGDPNQTLPTVGVPSDIIAGGNQPTPGEVATGGPGGEGGSGFDPTDALQFVPEIMNFATGVFGKDKTRPATQVNTQSVDMMPDRVNINPILSKNAANYRAILNDPNATTAQKLAAQSQKQQADSQAIMQKINKESQLKANKASLQSGLDRAQSRFDERFRQDKQISEANLGLTGNFARQALSDASQKGLMMERMNNMEDMSKQQIIAIASMLSEPIQNKYLKSVGANNTQ